MDISAIKTALQSLIQTLTSTTTIFANQNGPIPNTPFITLLITTTNKIGHDESEQSSDTQQTWTGQRELNVSIQAFGSTAYQLLSDLQDYFEIDSTRETLSASGLVYVENDAITNIDETLDTSIESRASMSVLFRIDSTRIYDRGIIEHAEVTQTVKKPTGDTAKESAYTIN